MSKVELEDGMQVIEDEEPVEKDSAHDDDSVEIKRLNPSKILSVLKAMLRGAIYEDSDFKVGKNSVSIDLQYDSRYTRNVYINELRKKFPGMVTVTGTLIKIVPPSNKNTGPKNDSGNRTQVKEDRRNGKSKKSLPGNEADTHQRKLPTVPDERHRLRQKV